MYKKYTGIKKLPINQPTDKKFKPSKQFECKVNGLIERGKNI